MERAAVQIELISREDWPTLFQKETTAYARVEKRALDDRAIQTARGALFWLHDRHLGLTPRLAFQLAELMLRPGPPNPRKNPWEAMLHRLRRELRGPKGPSVGKSEPLYGLRLGAEPAYSVMRLAMPLLARACRRVGRSVLFCQDALSTPFRLADYRNYERLLEAALFRLVEKEESNHPFWIERAHALAGLSQSGRLDAPMDAVPDTATEDFAILWRLRPRMPREHRDQRRQSLVQPIPHHATRLMKEGGVDGIHRTRRLEDLGEMLASEWLYPPEIRADRLINSGFLARRRPPKREKRRDVLMAALAPGLFTPTQMAFLKTCWCEALAAFRQVLQRQGLRRSEFRWIAGDRHGDARSLSVFPLDAVPPGPFARKEKANQRRKLLVPQGWTPHCFDERALHPDAYSAPKNMGPQDAAPLDWFASVWRLQTDHPYWRDQDPEEGADFAQTSDRLRVERFTQVHLLALAPTPPDEAPETDLVGFRHLLYAMELGDHPGASLSAVRAPEPLNDLKRWRWMPPNAGSKELFPNPERERTLEQIAGTLIHTWTRQWEALIHD